MWNVDPEPDLDPYIDLDLDLVWTCELRSPDPAVQLSECGVVIMLAAGIMTPRNCAASMAPTLNLSLTTAFLDLGALAPPAP